MYFRENKQVVYNKIKHLLFIIASLIFLTCKQEMQEIKLLTGDLKYCAYNMAHSEQTDDYKLYLAYYIEIHKNADFVLMRHDVRTGPQKYFSGTISNTICRLIDSTFLNRNYNADYTQKIDAPVIYDGFTYCFDYRKKNREKSATRYIPPFSPD